jgi:hypothetical protein
MLCNSRNQHAECAANRRRREVCLDDQFRPKASVVSGYMHVNFGESNTGGQRMHKASIAELQPGDVFTNRGLMALFRVSNSGGMRRSLETQSLVLVSDFTKSLYLDRWDGAVLHYCGMGQRGDQSLDFAQNRTLADTPGNGVEVHFFEVYRKNEYTYAGQLERAGAPFESTQDDVEGRPR